MRKPFLTIILTAGIIAVGVLPAAAAEMIGCVKVAEEDQTAKVECFEMIGSSEAPVFKNIQTIIAGSEDGDQFRLIKSEYIYHVLQFNGESGCLSVHRMTPNLEKLESYAMPCGLVPMEEMKGTMDRAGNMYLVLAGHDSDRNFEGKLNVIKMSPHGEFRIFPVLLTERIRQPDTFRDIRITVSEYSRSVYVAYIRAGLEDEFGELQMVSLDSVSGGIREQQSFDFKISAADDNLQLATNYLGQAFAVMGAMDMQGIRGIFSIYEEQGGQWSRPALIRADAGTPQLSSLSNDLVYMTSKSLTSSEIWLDILSSQAKDIINTLTYSDAMAVNAAASGVFPSAEEFGGSLSLLEEFSAGAADAVLIGLESKI